MKKTVGMMIQETLIEKNMSLLALGRGLCSRSSLTKYLNGTARIDRLLMTVFLQRIGKSPEKFTMLLTEEEYVYFEWRQEICLAHKNKDWKLIEELLQEKLAKHRACNAVLQEQFEQIMQVIVAEKLYGNTKECVRLLESAINKTVPDFQRGLKEDTLLSTQEISTILLWQKLQPDKEVSSKWLKELLQYLEKNYEDEQELIKIYPKVAAESLQVLNRERMYEQSIDLAEKVLGMMITTGYAPCMGVVITAYIEAAKGLGIRDKANVRNRQLQAWQELMIDIKPKGADCDDELFLLDVWQEIELIHEAIRSSRKEHKYSQEKLCEDICEPESMSRIETGKRAPHKSTYRKLAQKLSLPEEYYFTNIETDDFGVLELQWELETLLVKKQFEKAQDALMDLQGRIDISVSKNRQYVELMRYSIKRGMGKIPVESQLEQLREILKYTKPLSESWETEAFWKYHFATKEMSVLIRIADVLFSLDRLEEEVNLLENILSYYRKSKVSYDYHYRTVLLAEARLTSAYFRLGQYDRVLQYAKEGIRICGASGSYALLSGLVNNMANVLECLGKKDASLKYYRLAFYCADLMKQKSAEISKLSYEKLLSEEVEWY